MALCKDRLLRRRLALAAAPLARPTLADITISDLMKADSSDSEAAARTNALSVGAWRGGGAPWWAGAARGQINC